MRLHLPHHQRFFDRTLPSQNSQNHHEKLYEVLWADILELRKKGRNYGFPLRYHPAASDNSVSRL